MLSIAASVALAYGLHGQPGVYAWVTDEEVRYVGHVSVLRQIVNGTRMDRAYNDYTYVAPSKLQQTSSPRVGTNGFYRAGLAGSVEAISAPAGNDLASLRSERDTRANARNLLAAGGSRARSLSRRSPWLLRGGESLSQQSAPGASAPPEVIYIIRHGEKPADPPPTDPGQTPPPPAPPFGVDYQGNQDGHSLLPQGWQRSGALTVLFDPALGALQAVLQVPTALLSPSYGDPGKTTAHRTHQTVQGVSGRLGLQIASDFAEGQEPELAASVVSSYPGVVLICWEHDHIPALASSLPAAPGTVIPQQWPGDRFDVVWTFTLVPGSTPPQYTFGQIPQQVLSGDTATIISP